MLVRDLSTDWMTRKGDNADLGAGTRGSPFLSGSWSQPVFRTTPSTIGGITDNVTLRAGWVYKALEASAKLVGQLSSREKRRLPPTSRQPTPLGLPPPPQRQLKFSRQAPQASSGRRHFRRRNDGIRPHQGI